MKLAICLLTKGDSELNYLEKCLKSLQNAHSDIFLTITTDCSFKTEKLAKKYHCQTSFFEWCQDFAKARNFNFSQAKGYDYIFTCDSDDVVEHAGNLPKIMREMEKLNADWCYLPYITRSDGTESKLSERLVKNGSGVWKRSIHEKYVPTKEIKAIINQSCGMIHTKTEEDRTESDTQYLDMLRKDYKKTKDPLTAQYLGMDYHKNKKYKLSLTYYLKALPATVEDDRYFLLLQIANVYMSLREWENAAKYSLEAFELIPQWNAALFTLGEIYCEMGDYVEAIKVHLKGFKLSPPQTVVAINKDNYMINPLGRLAYCYHYLGMDDMAKEVFKSIDKLPKNDKTEKLRKELYGNG